ncbi:hypothetical protein J6590_080840 [Homalodisca vitripennis]|nr:hypothetical protein J6590_080840 [Homalodisca vitripennis]
MTCALDIPAKRNIIQKKLMSSTAVKYRTDVLSGSVAILGPRESGKVPGKDRVTLGAGYSCTPAVFRGTRSGERSGRATVNFPHGETRQPPLYFFGHTVFIQDNLTKYYSCTPAVFRGTRSSEWCGRVTVNFPHGETRQPPLYFFGHTVFIQDNLTKYYSCTPAVFRGTRSGEWSGRAMVNFPHGETRQPPLYFFGHTVFIWDNSLNTTAVHLQYLGRHGRVSGVVGSR